MRLAELVVSGIWGALLFTILVFMILVQLPVVAKILTCGQVAEILTCGLMMFVPLGCQKVYQQQIKR